MFNARDLLGQVMQAGMTDTTASRLRHAMGPKGLGETGNPLAQLFGQIGGAGGAGGGLAGRGPRGSEHAGREERDRRPHDAGSAAPAGRSQSFRSPSESAMASQEKAATLPSLCTA